jgi:hypothetical protein
LGGKQTAGFFNGVSFNFTGRGRTGIRDGVVAVYCHFNPYLIEICYNFESALIIASTPREMRVLSVQKG